VDLESIRNMSHLRNMRKYTLNVLPVL